MQNSLHRPERKPENPQFSSGPCRKRPGWSPEVLNAALFGRSHRSAQGKAKLKEVIDLTREILGIPADYRIAIVPGSDTGAVEMALWSLLGPRGVDIFVWEHFSGIWATDITTELQLADCRVFRADYGDLPDLHQAAPDRDIVFSWNGTTSGVRVPDGAWIAEDRTGLTICDATSAAFAMDLPWSRLDVTTWSWQKVLGGEGAHGMIVLSPRAAIRLTDHSPPWPMPKLFRMVSNGLLTEGLFAGETINTPSLLAVEDAIDGLHWARDIGGIAALQKRCQRNFDRAAEWVARSNWCEFLARRPEIRSQTSICLKINDPTLDPSEYPQIASAVARYLARENVAYDVNAYRTAPAGFRFWGGATIETADLACALEWLDWSYHAVRQSMRT
ncbi:phosphoserine transaminase [Gluconacetobacter aggeris]|uniref:phosphoserine transaminase n=1 Tax=Gluconacetobacter aggeris TaxID=1286186 RepID=A0A7W4NVP2_9PROT|nr:phosphoserine transaminase [Gluconacetobacter aggeris]MBB2168041.1 phosphoserine transaminase [Gluconacetobacter aggeris]